MGFGSDLKLEEEYYNKVFKPWLNSRGNDSIFIRFNSNNIIYELLQKKNDVDIILDNGTENISLSLKVRRSCYNDIFFETISNCNKNTPGWGYYSKADFIVYSMGDFINGFLSILFNPADVKKLNLEKYKIQYGKTYNNNKLLYKTEGRIIPFSDFKHTLLFDQRKNERR